MCDGRDDEGIGFSDCLQACHQVRGLANGGVLLSYALPNKIAHDDHPRADGDAGLQCLTTCCPQVSDSSEDGKAGEDCPLRIILVRGRITEIRKHPATQLLRDHAAEGFNLVGASSVEGGDDLTLLFGIKACRERA
jgi:hypothetical protein